LLRIAPFLIPCTFALIGALSAAILWNAIPDSAIAVIAIAAVAGGIIVTFIAASLAVSLKRATEGARRFAAGELTGPIEREEAFIAKGLIDALNDMAAKLNVRLGTASQEHNRALAALNSSVDAVIAVDAQDRISFVNLAAERLFARSKEELIGNPFVWIMPDAQIMNALRTSRKEGRSESAVLDRPRKRHLQVITTPIIGGGDWAALAVFHDLTAIRRTEQVRRDFVANVSHELRTPLASIKSVIETLQSGALDDRSVAEEFLGRADLEVDRLAQMVEELLELSRIESGEVPLARQPIDLGNVVNRAVSRLRAQAEKQNMRLELKIDTELPEIIGDAERLERAVVNLVHNAIKFSTSGGSIYVLVGTTVETVTVSVRDAGAGIEPEDVPRVFERFYKADRSRHGGGTGLGLAIVKHTVEAHGGTVNVTSEPGRGSTFSFAIPIR